MMIRKQNLSDSRGVSAVEAAVVYPVTMLLLIGMVVLGLGVSRYQQLQALADEGARYASVHGPSYASDNGVSVASTTDIQNNVLTPMAAGLPGVSCSAVSYSASSLPCTVTVTITYTWNPEGYLHSVTWSLTSTTAANY
jgi:Flp pilus assembly protein TadG